MKDDSSLIKHVSEVLISEGFGICVSYNSRNKVLGRLCQSSIKL
jgi:hypothetical protein